MTPRQPRLRPWRPGAYITEQGSVVGRPMTPVYRDAAQKTLAVIRSAMRREGREGQPVA